MLRKRLLALITIVVSTAFALIIGELFLLVYSSGPPITDQMDEGLIRYHPRYGWNLTPGWKGQHNHTDYTVHYRVGPTGFRHDDRQNTRQGAAQSTPHSTPHSTPQSNPQSTSRQLYPIVSKHLIVGDSFTFGLGANDNETFAALLNQGQQTDWFTNGAVPGYSPEQILLKATDLSRALKPDNLIVMIYLGNDLVDLGLEFPAQAEFPKPFAQMVSGGWELAGLPVPRKQKPAAAQLQTLGSFVVKPGSTDWISTTQTGRRLIKMGVIQDSAELNMERVKHSLTLFEGFLRALKQIPGPEQMIVLLPGSVAINQPDSVTGQYQRYLEREILNMTRAQGTEGWSLLPYIENQPVTSDLYYPNDGHLTPKGHQLVAAAISKSLEGRSLMDSEAKN